MKCTKVIHGCLRYHHIEELTIIDGYNILFSGNIEKFMGDCDPVMIPYRNEIMNRTVAEKTVLHEKLFVFLNP